MSSQVALIEAVLRSLVKNERASASAVAREVIQNAQGAGDLVFERAALRSLKLRSAPRRQCERAQWKADTILRRYYFSHCIFFM